jgi:hypothetical protein
MRHSLVSDPDCLRGAERKVEAAAARERTAIIDAHSYPTPVLGVLDLHDRAQRQSDGCRSKSTGIGGSPLVVGPPANSLPYQDTETS